MIELLGMRVLEWICSVYTIDLGCLQYHVGIDFDGAQAGRGVGGEERVAGTGSEDYDFFGVQVAHGFATIIVIGNANHGDGRHDDRGNVGALKRVAHGQAIHYGRQHAHVVASDAVHAGCTERRATEQVATADYQTDLNTDADQLANFKRHAIQHFRVDPELFRAHQGLAAKFEQNAFIARLATTHLLSHCESLLRRTFRKFVRAVCSLLTVAWHRFGASGGRFYKPFAVLTKRLRA
ncbi:hypothetical protein D3C75_794940 [compost metagenome]